MSRRVPDNTRRFYAPEHLIKKERFLEKPPDSVSVYRKLLKVAWPATLESVLLGLVSFVDGLMVSTVGTAAIAAVGVTNQPRLLFFCRLFAMNIGVTAIVSRRKGRATATARTNVLRRRSPSR